MKTDYDKLSVSDMLDLYEDAVRACEKSRAGPPSKTRSDAVQAAVVQVDAVRDGIEDELNKRLGAGGAPCT